MIVLDTKEVVRVVREFPEVLGGKFALACAEHLLRTKNVSESIKLAMHLNGIALSYSQTVAEMFAKRGDTITLDEVVGCLGGVPDSFEEELAKYSEGNALKAANITRSIVSKLNEEWKDKIIKLVADKVVK